jgi:hypothetical protein
MRAIGLNAQDTAHLNFNIDRNQLIEGYGGPVLEIFSTGTAAVQGHIDNNGDIENNGTTNRAGSPIFIDTEDSSSAVVDISGNTIKHLGQDAGIDALVQGNGTNLHSATQDLTIASNSIDMTGSADANNGILFQAGGEPNDTTSIFANVHNNSVTLGNAVSPLAFALENTAAGSNIFLQGFVTDAQHTWAANNNTPGTSEGELLDHAVSGIPAGHHGGFVLTPTNPTALFLASGGVASTTGSTGETHLTQAELNKVVAAAIANWAAAGLSSDKIAALEHVTYDVANITPGWLGQSTPGHVTIDASADGHGWFVDPTPQDNSEFAHQVSATNLATDPTTDAAGHIDLLSTVMHEMGEQLGLSDVFAPSAQGSLMFAFLADGERVLPSSTDAVAANAATSIVPAWHGGDSFNFNPPATNPPPPPAQASGGPAPDNFVWVNPAPADMTSHDGPAAASIFPADFHWSQAPSNPPPPHVDLGPPVDVAHNDTAAAMIMPDKLAMAFGFGLH